MGPVVMFGSYLLGLTTLLLLYDAEDQEANPAGCDIPIWSRFVEAATTDSDVMLLLPAPIAGAVVVVFELCSTSTCDCCLRVDALPARRLAGSAELTRDTGCDAGAAVLLAV